ncbi:hypothetical protein BZB76_2473 [Actinomadura pelletieri DSM 43383]|uniref:Uncharacterized protein n=1 Tax=Actinomadura pelletieri DSM 43383 TaxID=1120940 RepID=A0A495QUC6_9ACTN|nr:DUF6221 family protein [Actinomadura pelletieri]RKS77100.1 hypothetical protein BZB76_2473 [Actinomadura pelletieri DSM 43383]
MDLVEFLRDRLAKDEQLARACAASSWTAEPSGSVAVDAEDPTFVATAENQAYVEHIARHDPARTLREVAAARQIVDDYEKESWIIDQGHRTPELEAAHAARESVLRLLALPHAAHPAYQDEWRP